jgi:hypothetical protein
MAASLRGRKPESRGTSTVGSRYQAEAVKAENTSLCVCVCVCVIVIYKVFKSPVNPITNPNPVYNFS